MNEHSAVHWAWKSVEDQIIAEFTFEALPHLGARFLYPGTLLDSDEQLNEWASATGSQLVGSLVDLQEYPFCNRCGHVVSKSGSFERECPRDHHRQRADGIEIGASRWPDRWDASLPFSLYYPPSSRRS